MAEELNQDDTEIDSDIKNSDRDSIIDNTKLSENDELQDGTIEPKNLSEIEQLNDGHAEDSGPFETRELNDENTVQQSNMEDQLEYGDEEENFESINSQPEEDNLTSNQQEDEVELVPVLLEGRFEIISSQPLPEFDSPSAKAFETIDKRGVYPNLFALICIPGLVTRVEEAEQIVRQKIPGLMSLMAYGQIDWPIISRKTFALVYEKPTGGRVNEVFKIEESDYQKTEFIHSIVSGVVEAFEQLSTRGIVHRSLRADNLFFVDEQREKVVIGEFLASPPGFDQPVIYETIENGMANPGAREHGTIMEDMYAFGVLLATLSQRELPCENDNTEEIIVSKIANSSFATLIGKQLITSRFLELIRGLISDTAKERWVLAQITNWLNSMPIAPTPKSAQHEAHRPIEFGGFNHFYVRTIAYSMSQHREEAVTIIRDGKLLTWIEKDYDDDIISPHFKDKLEAINLRADRARDTDELLLSLVLIVLDPLSPITYKDQAYMPNAFNTAIVCESVRGGDYKALSESILHDIPDFWEEVNEERETQNRIEKISFSRLRSHLQRSSYGYGIERCIYELNWDFPCKSPLLEKEYVDDVGKLLTTLDLVEKNIDPDTHPMDPHIAAFIGGRVRKSVAKFLQPLGNTDEAKSILATIRLFSLLQTEYGPETLPNLTKWIGAHLGGVIKMYKSQSTQKMLENRVPEIIRNGQLKELLNLIDNPEIKHTDSVDYEEALKTFQSAQEEVERITQDMAPEAPTAILISRKAAAITSASIMTFSIIIMFFSL